jgi:hypothetical protein
MTRHLLKVFEKCARTLKLTPSDIEILNQQITSNRARLHLHEGKHALIAGGANVALDHFQQANQHFRSPKLNLVIVLLRHLPRVVIWVFTERERLHANQADHQLTGIDQPRVTF